ncbi:hypothetical protein EVAR_68216_1 [Eumeta japonica]|uniref:Uncharacterized protein n=1 Tax=Eumeta variegata TaxID=151549 RepID=A0A4C1ZZY7_EUMVA|nr:hypothetical protein EVAR_68216_1 [Eumeta japonica]
MRLKTIFGTCKRDFEKGWGVRTKFLLQNIAEKFLASGQKITRREHQNGFQRSDQYKRLSFERRIAFNPRSRSTLCTRDGLALNYNSDSALDSDLYIALNSDSGPALDSDSHLTQDGGQKNPDFSDPPPISIPSLTPLLVIMRGYSKFSHPLLQSQS